MMSVKKNLTVATLAALLAVPAFGATNVGNIHINNLLRTQTINANADSTVSLPSSYQGHWSGYNSSNGGPSGKWSVTLGPNSGYMHRYYPGDNEQGPIVYTQNSNGKYSWWPKGMVNQAGAGPAGSYFYKLPNGQLAWKEDTGTSYLSKDSANPTSKSSKDNTGTSSTSTNGGANNTQYTSKNSLPQTGENNGASKAMAAGAVALGASTSLMALSIAKKHKQDANLETITSAETTVGNGNGKDNTESNTDKSVYNMIMGDTFKNISNDLKKM